MEINPLSVVASFSDLVKVEFSNLDNATVSEGETLVAKELLKRLKEIMQEFVLDEDQELIQEESQASEGSTWSQGSYVDDDGNEVAEDSSNATGYVSLQRKEEILKLIEEHPKWKHNTILTHGGKELKHMYYKQIWTKQVLEGGTKHDKLKYIDNFVIERFHEARKELKCVKEIHLRQWAIQASQSFRDSSFVFTASRYWAHHFKVRHSITSRKVTKLVSRRKIQSMDSLLDSAKHFQENIKALKSSFTPNLILNTDQVGFFYEMTDNRTLSYKGEKTTVAVAKSPRNLATHSYTVQYTISMDGDIVGDVFVCLQELGGRMGPIVKETLLPVPNVTVTCSSSGKVTRSLFEYYLDEIIVKNIREDFLFLVDSYAGQTNACSYVDRFGTNTNPACNLKVIPENCTDVCQPLDTTFHRQLKYFARALFTEFALKYSNDAHPADEITTRNNIIKLHSLLHNQLSSPIFRNMIKYSWFSAGLTDERPVFLSVKETCFTFTDSDKVNCETCDSLRFLKCANCRKVFCFKCFFYDFHFHFNASK